MAKGFAGLPGNMQGLMKQAQKVQEQLRKTQEEMATLTAEASSGGGMVKVVVNGKNEIISVLIEREVVNPDDIEMLQDLIKAAGNEALLKVQEQVKERYSKITGGFDIPGLF